MKLPNIICWFVNRWMLARLAVWTLETWQEAVLSPCLLKWSTGLEQLCPYV